jgi:hypothetical protein
MNPKGAGLKARHSKSLLSRLKSEASRSFGVCTRALEGAAEAQGVGLGAHGGNAEGDVVVERDA